MLQRRLCLLPTWRGWLALVCLAASVCLLVGRSVYGFLAVHEPIPGGILVVEGWAPDYALEATLTEFRAHSYERIYVTGVPIESGEFLSEYRSFAERSAAVLVQKGAEKGTVQAVPSPQVRQDRTYATALALRHWLEQRGVAFSTVNVVSLGAHSRRTRLLYRRAFGPDTRIGIFAVPARDFDPDRWWVSSQGFRIVTGEVMAWIYASLIFRPSAEADGRGLSPAAGEA